MKRMLATAAVLASAATAMAVWWHAGTRTAPTWDVQPVRAMALEHVIVERGVLSSRDAVPVLAMAEGDIIEIVRTGTRVDQDQVLVRIDAEDLRERVDELRLEVETARMNLDVHRAEYALTRLREENRLAVQGERLAVARLREAQVKTPLQPEDRRLLEIDLALAELSLEDAQDALVRQERLLEKDFVAASMVAPYRRRVRSAEARLEEIRATISLREKGQNAELVVEQEQQVARLEAQIERGRRAMARRLQAVTNRIVASVAGMNKDAYLLEREEAALHETETRAPTNGIFSVRLFRDWRSGGNWQEFKPGISVRRTDILGDVINPGSMSVEFMVHEVDIGSVETGMPVRITVPALAGRVFDGTLVRLGGLGRDRYDIAAPGQEESRTGVTVFNAIADIHGADAEFCPGMSALVEIALAPAQEQLAIPREAVQVASDASGLPGRAIEGTVVREDGSQVTVTGAFRGLLHFAVHEGLAAGDSVRVPRTAEATP